MRGGFRPATRIVTGISVAAAFAAGFLSAAGSAAAEPPKWGAFLDLEGKLGTERHLGEADLFLPLAQDSDTLLFADLRFRLDDESSREGNFGLGLRHMLPGGWNLGAYGYFDRRRTESGHYFSQATFGAELLGRDLDFRVNGYLPLGDRVKGLGTTSGGTPFAQLSGTTVQVVTPGATTVEERALSGFDVEAGWRVPVFAAEGPYDLRIYGGLFRFEGDAVETVTGPRLRAELTAFEVPGLWEGARVTLGAEWQSDGVRGPQGFAGVRLRIPLQGEARDDTRLTLQERRMTAPVVRDIDIVTQARTETTPATVETAVDAGTGQTLDTVTVLDSGTAYGTDLTDELTAAGANSVVILNGTFNTTATTTLQTGQTVMGGGSTFTVRGADTGATATFTAPGSAGTVAGTVVTAGAIGMADDSTISGLTVSNTSASVSIAIAVGFGDRATIADSTVTATATGIGSNATAIRAASASDGLVVRDNTIVATGQANATGFSLTSGNTKTNVTVAGNSFDASGSFANRAISVSNTGFVTTASTGNTIVNGGCLAGVNVTGEVSFTGGTTCP